MPMSNTNLNQVVSPQGMMSGLVPTRRVGQRIGMPQTVRRPFAPQGGMRGIAPISAFGARPPRAGMANMAPRISGMAMGGPIDFEHVLGDSANLTQALGAFSSPMRLAKGGLAEQSLMDQIGSLLKRVHKSWHEHMLSGGLVNGYADGGAARFDPYQLRRQFRSIHLKAEPPTLQDFQDMMQKATSGDPGSDVSGYLSMKNWLLPTPASAGAYLGMYSPDAGASNEWAMMPRDYMRQMRQYYRGRGQNVPPRYEEPLNAMTGAMAPSRVSPGDLPGSLQNQPIPAWAR